MRNISISELIKLLEKPLAQEDMKASDILLLRENLQESHYPFLSDSEKENFQNFELPEGILNLPIQYTNGEYNDQNVRGNKKFLSQGLVTVFDPDFCRGRLVKNDSGEPHRPLVSGYLDFENENELENHVSESLDIYGRIINPSFTRAHKFKNGLWIGGIAENDAKGLVTEHIIQFARLYRIRKFLKNPQRNLMNKSFIE